MEAPLSGVLRGLADGFTLHSAIPESLRTGQRQRHGTGRRDEKFSWEQNMEQLRVLCVEGKSRISHSMSICVRVQLKIHVAWRGSSIRYCGGKLQFPVLF